MKCIRCGTDNNLKSRTANAGRCTRCNHPFVFEPTSMNWRLRLTDAFFQKAINDISATNSLYFTPKQLFYLLEKRISKKNSTNISGLTAVSIGLIIFGVFLSATGVGVVLFGVGVVLLLLGILRSLLSRIKRPSNSAHQFVLNQNQVQTWLDLWNHINSAPNVLAAVTPSNRPVSVPPDVTAYSFDRLVVCDHDAIAQLLIVNNVHFENNCAVLSINGYPQSIFDTTMEMLRRNPDLKVYALHDCSPQGLELVHQLRTRPNWFPDGNTVIVDVGLLPRQVLAAKGNMIVLNTVATVQAAQTLSEVVRQGLTAAEVQWLTAGNIVELESFTPQALIQILNRSIAGSRDLNTVDGGDSSFIFIGGGDSYIYASDSFG